MFLHVHSPKLPECTLFKPRECWARKKYTMEGIGAVSKQIYNEHRWEWLANHIKNGKGITFSLTIGDKYSTSVGKIAGKNG